MSETSNTPGIDEPAGPRDSFETVVEKAARKRGRPSKAEKAARTKSAGVSPAAGKAAPAEKKKEFVLIDFGDGPAETSLFLCKQTASLVTGWLKHRPLLLPMSPEDFDREARPIHRRVCNLLLSRYLGDNPQLGPVAEFAALWGGVLVLNLTAPGGEDETGRFRAGSIGPDSGSTGGREDASGPVSDPKRSTFDRLRSAVR